METRFIKDIYHPIDELKRLKYQLIEDIKYWEELKIIEKVKLLEAKKHEYERAINCLELELHKYD